MTNWYGNGLLTLLDTPTDMEGVTCKLALATNSYTPNRNTHDFRDDFTAAELANGNGYTTGGVTLSGVTWSLDTGSEQVRLTFSNPSWTFSASKTFRYAILYIDTGGADSTDPLIGLLTYDADQTVSGVWTIDVATAGYFLHIDYT